MANKFMKVKTIFLGDANHMPWFKCRPNIPVKMKVNQLPKSAVCSNVSSASKTAKKHRKSEHTINVRRSSNTGIAIAITQATIQRAVAMPTHELTPTQSRLCMRSVPAKIRMYIDFAATWLLMTPAITI